MPRLMFPAAERSALFLLERSLATVRYEATGTENYRRFWDREEPVVFVLWHGRLLPLAYLHRGQGLVTLVSRSRDGDRIARTVERWGYSTVRGSSSRGGGTAFRSLLRHAAQGRSLVFTPDGPRGPMQEMKPGALVAAQLAGLPIIPAAAGTDRAWWFGSWDRFLVPKPFARVRVAYGAPHRVDREADEAERGRISRHIKAALDALLRMVDRRETVA